MSRKIHAKTLHTLHTPFCYSLKFGVPDYTAFIAALLMPFSLGILTTMCIQGVGVQLNIWHTKDSTAAPPPTFKELFTS